jgi:MtrB/PioB family decaheme-associated outer membrane protein
MKRLIVIVAIALALTLPLANTSSGQDSFEGAVRIKGQLADVNGDKAKFNEYRDIRDGIYGDIRLKYDSDAYFMKFDSSNIGYDDQEYNLEGGMWGKFKYKLFYNEIPHNFTFGARTFYSGAGSDTLTYAPLSPSPNLPNLDAATWSKFDYSIERKQYGGGVILDLMKPFYLDVSVAREERSGIRATGVPQDQTGGSNQLELPEPVDYITDTLKVEAGYAQNPFFASLSYFYSRFDNDNRNLNFVNPLSANTLNAPLPDVLTLPPDNNYYKLAFKGALKLPLNSKFNMNLGLSQTKSDVRLLNYYIMNIAGPPPGVQSISLSDSKFDGDIRTQNYAFSITSNPVPFMTGKISYRYYDRNNKSDEITTVDTNANAGLPFKNHIFEYTKKSFGAEADFRLMADLYLTTGYRRIKTDRERGDLPESTDNIYSVDLRWKGLDFLHARIGYERLDRNADHEIPAAIFAADQTQVNIIEQYVRRYDAAPLDRDTYRASVDIYPAENLSFGLGFKHRKSDYKDTVLGLTDEKSNEFNISADYAVGTIASLSAYYDYERIKYSQFQRRYQTVPDGADPFTGLQNATEYNWEVEQRDKGYDYGFGVDFYVVPRKLTLRLSHDYVRSDGNADFTYYVDPAIIPPVGQRNQDNVDISNVDDYRRTSFLVKAIYDLSKSIAVTGGYAYERYKYRDAQLDNYLYVYGNTNYLTGAYKDQSYKANVVFVALTYKF